MQDQRRTKGVDEIFCPSCGEAVKREAVICVKCGVPLRGASGMARSKDKTVAVILAVFLSFWTWCYTYQKDAWKFWLNLGLSVVTLGIWGIVAWIWAIVDVARRPEEFYVNFDQSPGGQPSAFTVPAMPPSDPEGLRTYRRNQLLIRLSTANRQAARLRRPSAVRRIVLPLLAALWISTFIVIPVLVGVGPKIPNADPPEFPGWYSGLIFAAWAVGAGAGFVALRTFLA